MSDTSHGGGHGPHCKPGSTVSTVSAGGYTCPMHPQVRSPGRGACPDCGMALEPELPGMHTCPMHPEVRSPGPGVCPDCGMALEPESPANADRGADPELEQMTRRFWVALVLTLPVFWLSMAEMVPGLKMPGLSARAAVWVQLLFSAPVVLWAGWPFFARGFRSVLLRRPNMFTLIGLGTGVAFTYSAVATLIPKKFPASFRSADGTVAVYFEAAAVIVTLVLLGQVFELRARLRTGAAIRGLIALAPETALRVHPHGADEVVPLHAVTPGDLLRIRPGDRVPVDGRVVEGASAVDESAISGEPIPAAKRAGAKVTGGTLNGRGAFVMRAERVGAETLLARIVSLVAQAQRSRAPIQRLADRVAGWFVPAVLLAAIAAFAVWAWWGPPPALALATIHLVAVLIIACPCALGLATPMSIMVGTGRGAQMGILIRNAEVLERFAEVDTLLVDKTGTLTEGRPELVAVLPADGAAPWKPDELLACAAAIEGSSHHPLAEAFARAAPDDGPPAGEVEGFEDHPGLGISGRVAGRSVAIGSAELLKRQGVDTGPLAAASERLRGEGRIVVLMAVDGSAAGVFGLNDPIKPTSAEALRRLRADGVEVRMLTGDDRATAEAVARELGIDQVDALVLPQDKHEVVERLIGDGRVVAMAGDGINDAPALARADVGIAMGTGADVAIESADITLVEGDLRALARARRLSRSTLRNIRQNLFFAFVYNGLGVPLAAGALYPLTGLSLSPMLAAAAMSLSSVSVIANALRLYRLRI